MSQDKLLAEIEATAKALEALIEQVESEEIRHYLQGCLSDVEEMAEWEEVA